MKYPLLTAVLLALVACGDSGTVTDAAISDTVFDASAGDAVPVDAPIDAVPIDAVPSTVLEVPCTGATIVSEVSAPGFAFVVTVSTIAVGDVVRFTMPDLHSAISGATPGIADGQFSVAANQVKCLRFTAPGPFPFWCNPHQFTGLLTVVPAT